MQKSFTFSEGLTAVAYLIISTEGKIMKLDLKEGPYENEQKKVCPFAVSRKKGLSVMGCLICEHHNCERGTR